MATDSSDPNCAARVDTGQDLPIFVISLRDADARRDRMARHLGALGLAFEFFDAVDGRAGMPALRAGERLFAEECARHYPLLRSHGLGAEEVACYLSHLRLAKRCLARGVERALVLEDDMAGSGDLPEVLRATAAMPASFELVRLHQTRAFVGLKPVAALLGGRYELCRLWPFSVSSTGAYCISRPGMERFARHFGDIRMPIDTAMDRVWETGLRSYVVRPNPVRHSPAHRSVMGRAGTGALPVSPPWSVRCRAAPLACQRCLDGLWHMARQPREFL